MDFRMLYLILPMLYMSTTYARHNCHLSERQCTYQVDCWSLVDISDINQFMYPPNGAIGCQTAVTYKNQKYYAIELGFHQSSSSVVHDLELIPPLADYYNYDIGEYENYIYQDFTHITSSLDLSQKTFKYTPVIRSMQNLVTLNLSSNYLSTAVLSNDHKLNLLTKLDLSHNVIKYINVNSKAYPYDNLRYIDMSYNLLDQIPDSIFSEFKYLQKLNVSYNCIDNLNQLTFQGTNNVTDLDISNNRLVSINSSLVNLTQLINLNLSSNKIENILPNEFDWLFKLETLDLSHNFIRKINTSLLRKVTLLKVINLCDNLLEVIDKDIFSNLKLLNSVDISKNKLTFLPVSLFQNNILHFVITENKLEGSLERGMLDKVNVEKLNFSHQYISEIKDYAFYNLTKLKELLLNSNNIKILSNESFSTLVNLEILNLSDNQIIDISFEKKDLRNIQSLLLQNNRLLEVNYEQLQHLTGIKCLNLSGNLISRFGLNTFRSLRNLMKFDISNNSLVGILESETFYGLDLVPYLDISRNKLTAIQNATFNNMTELKDLNISNGLINDLQYNAFINTGFILTLDVSYNKLQCFTVNATHLVSLMTLLLNNNLIITITSNSFSTLSQLYVINLSHNAIKNLIDNIDSSTTVLEKSYPNNLYSSGAGSTAMKAYLHLSVLDSLDLSHNNISSLQVGYFSGLGAITSLDLSFNEILFVQPGTFKNNNNLISLNLSHNYLQSVNYGIFRGLNNMIVLNMSYNELKELHEESFSDVRSLSQLIVDFNLIKFIDYNLVVKMAKLSIGDNPLPCKILVQYIRKGFDSKITAIRLHEHSNENVDGVVCNKAQDIESSVPDHMADNDMITNKLYYNLSQLYQSNNDILEKISHIFEQSNDKLTNLTNLSNLTYKSYNDILEKISHISEQSNFSNPTYLNGYQWPASSYLYNELTIIATCLALILLLLIGLVFYKVYKCKFIFKNQCTYRIREFSEGIENSVL